MAWPMLEWTLETYYRDCFHAVVEEEQAILVRDGLESVLLPLMRDIEGKYDKLRLFSLPFLGDTTRPRHIELGVRGEPAQVAAAMTDIREGVEKLGYVWGPVSAGCTPVSRGGSTVIVVIVIVVIVVTAGRVFSCGGIACRHRSGQCHDQPGCAEPDEFACLGVGL